jgi:hypothetical protein
MTKLYVDRSGGAWECTVDRRILGRFQTTIEVSRFARKHGYKVVWCSPWDEPARRAVFDQD